MRRAAKIDENQPSVVSALRSVGATVACTHSVGKGFPDLVVGYRGLNLLIEVKDGDKPESRRRLTKDQIDWHNEWRGTVYVVNNVPEALNLLNGVSNGTIK